jgi:tetratricopeptide (TPR) repeat protein
MRFSICLVEPEGYKFSHFLYDYCKYLCFTIEAAGYECCMVRNYLYSDRINIIMGAHYLTDPALVGQIRGSGEYVILQSEVLREGGIAGWPEQSSYNTIYVPLMRHALAVLDGFEPNFPHLRKLGIEPEKHISRFGYLRAMEEIVHKKEKDIDFMYYGSMTPHRVKLIEELRRLGGNVVCIFDDAAIFRNDLIARTRINLAPSQAEGINHLTLKTTYLLNNRSLVVVERCWNQKWVEHCFLSANTEEFVDLCMRTVKRRDLDQLANEYFEQYKKLDQVYLIRPLIEKLIASSKLHTSRNNGSKECTGDTNRPPSATGEVEQVRQKRSSETFAGDAAICQSPENKQEGRTGDNPESEREIVCHNDVYLERPSEKEIARRLCEQAVLLQQAGKTDLATEQLQLVLKLDKDNGEAHNDLGVLYYQAGDTKEAICHLQEAMKLEPENVDYRKNIAEVYLELGKVEEAIDLYGRILDENINDTEVLTALAEISSRLGLEGDARAYVSRILEFEPDNRYAREFVGNKGTL